MTRTDAILIKGGGSSSQMDDGNDVAADGRRHKAHLHVLAEGKGAVMIAAEGECLWKSRLNQGDNGDIDEGAVAVRHGGELHEGDQPADGDGVGRKKATPERDAAAAHKRDGEQ